MTTATAAPLGNAVAAATKRLFNFSAGPGALADEVVQQAQADLWDVMGSGIGIMEHSHRGKVFDKILGEAEENCRKIGNIPANYKIMFMTGGATSQNHLVPANLLPDNAPAAFITTGYWAERTFEEASVYTGRAYESFDGRKNKHTFCPADAEITYKEPPAYVHMCSNNTIYGTQFRNADGSIRYPKVPDGVPLVCDMSSDMYSRPVDFSRFGLVYGGAQKNIGVAGTTMVIIREDLLKPVRKLPTMMRYDICARDQSRHNTPPVFAIYMSGLVFKWILAQGGVDALHKRNLEKANIIYGVLDKSQFYKGHARPDSRSLMNITFRTPSEELDNKFIAEAAKLSIDGIKGHRATGGVRASTYNAFPREGCEVLAQFMQEFERRNG